MLYSLCVTQYSVIASSTNETTIYDFLKNMENLEKYILVCGNSLLFMIVIP